MDPADPSPGSRWADATAARRALDLAAPMIEATLAEPSICGSGFLCVVVVDPALTPRDCAFDAAVLVERAFGERARWDADYAAFARAKARLTWQHGLDGVRLQHECAHVLRAGDSLLRGAVCLDGIVVGVSGAHPDWDEAFATAVAANLRAIARQSQAQARAADRATA